MHGWNLEKQTNWVQEGEQSRKGSIVMGKRTKEFVRYHVDRFYRPTAGGSYASFISHSLVQAEFDLSSNA